MSLVPGDAPSYNDWSTKNTRQYSQILGNALTERYAGQRYRQAAYDRISGQTRAAEGAIKDQAATGLGFSQTPQTGQMIAQVRQNAPYAAADLAAREAGTQSAIQVGQEVLAKKAAHATWWTSMMQPFLQERSLELQQQQIENAAALGLAGLSGGGDSNATTNALIGAGGSLGAAALIAFA